MFAHMKKLTALLLVVLALLLCSCSKKTNSEVNVSENSVTVCDDNEALEPIEISDEQATEICELIGLSLSADLRQIQQIVSVDKVKKFNLDESEYYYNFFKHNDINLLLIYDSEYLTLGCVYYDMPIGLEELSNAVTFEDVVKTDKTTADDDIGFNELSAQLLFSRREYAKQSDFESETLHFTNEGIYIVYYDVPLNINESAQINVTAIEKVDDEVYCKAFDIICNSFLG